MNEKQSAAAKVGRVTLLAAFCALLAGLPLAVEYGGIPHKFLRSSIASITHNAVVVLSPISLSDKLALTLDAGLVGLAGRSDGASADKRVLVDDARLTLDFRRLADAPERQSGRAAPEPNPPAIDYIGSMGIGTIQIRRGTLTLIGGSGRQLFISDVMATVTSTRSGDYELTGKGRFNGQPVAIDGSWSDGDAKPGERAQNSPLRLKLSSAFFSTEFDGQLSGTAKDGKPVLTGNAAINVPSLPQFLHWSGFGAALESEFGSISVTGPVTWDFSRMAFARAVVQIDDNAATGALTFKHAGGRPAVDATLAFDTLDLRPMLGPRTSAPLGNVGKQTGAHLLSLLDADLRVSTSKFVLAGLETGKGAVTVALNDGRLGANVVDLEIEGGKADGQITMDVNQRPPQATVKFKALGVDAGRMFTASLPRNPLVGPTNVTFEGTADGATIAEALTKLTGRGSFELAEAGRLGLDLVALVNSAKTAKVVSWAGAGNGGTQLEKMSCRFRIINGAVTVEAMQARSGDTAIFGSGRLDIPGRLMDISVASGPATRGEVPATATDVLSMRGTWDNPAISLATPAEPAIKAVEWSPPAQ